MACAARPLWLDGASANRGPRRWRCGMNALQSRRVAFFTIGQSPRSDVVPEMARLLGDSVRIDEFGALDGLDAAALAAMAPRDGEYRFATRMRDGAQIELDAARAEARLADVMRQADDAGYDVLVPL